MRTIATTPETRAWPERTVSDLDGPCILPNVGHVSAPDYERILEIVAEASRGEPEEPLPDPVLDMIRVLARCDAVAFFEGAPWDRTGRRVWMTPIGMPWTDEEKAIVDHRRFDVPLYPSSATLDRAVRISDAMSQRRYQNLELYQEGGRRHRIEYAMDYWMHGAGGHVRGLRFDDSTHDFSDRTKDAVEVLGRHLRTVLARRDRGIGRTSINALTPREAEILAFLARGLSNREIARVLSISPHTVRKHLENAFVALGVHSRAEAVARTYRGRPI